VRDMTAAILAGTALLLLAAALGVALWRLRRQRKTIEHYRVREAVRRHERAPLTRSEREAFEAIRRGVGGRR